jgi:putative hydrolases of HD superfamily
MERIQRQLAFLVELDRLKSVVRESLLVNRERRENSAEHSWRLAPFALTLSNTRLALTCFQVVKLLLVHDVVEIDVGDISLHSAGRDPRSSRLRKGGLPGGFLICFQDQREDALSLWLEFEVEETPNCRFARALDRLQPLLLNTLTNGGIWKEHNVTEQQVKERYGPRIDDGSPELWQVASLAIRRHFREG